MGERVVVLGAGIAGLSVALALGGSGRDVTILERDPPPPDDDAQPPSGAAFSDLAFAEWRRVGVSHLRHSHAFLARLYQLIRDHHPKLLEELVEAGCRELGFATNLRPPMLAKYRPLPGDAALTTLMSRRTTLELVMRRYAARQPGITFVPATRVQGLLLDRDAAGLRAGGVVAEDRHGRRDWPADIVIDAGGKGSHCLDWLRAAGATLEADEGLAGILYFTRHYRLNDGAVEPPRGAVPGAGDLGYLKYCVFPADNRWFSITLAVPEIETELRRAVMSSTAFDTICGALPGIARWVATETSTPQTKVFGMGQLLSRWHHLVPGGRPLVSNFFAIGDAAIRTNPLYGRGCTFAAIQAQLLRETLDGAEDPAERAIRFDRDVTRTLRPFYDAMAKIDADAITRAARALDPFYRPRLKARLAKSFSDDAIGPAIRGEIRLLRAYLRAFHMIDPPAAWLKRPRNAMTILSYWLRPKSAKAHLYLPPLGPDRGALLAQLDLPLTVDPERSTAAA
jgi:2-polyprenyl-6-methoxyphenol hydroxylase-like FAD-dependent oxidoreductase